MHLDINIKWGRALARLTINVLNPLALAQLEICMLNKKTEPKSRLYSCICCSIYPVE